MLLVLISFFFLPSLASLEFDCNCEGEIIQKEKVENSRSYVLSYLDENRLIELESEFGGFWNIDQNHPDLRTKYVEKERNSKNSEFCLEEREFGKESKTLIVPCVNESSHLREMYLCLSENRLKKISSLFCNRKAVLEAVRKDGNELWNVCKELRNDREIVGAAVSQNGRSLLYASDLLRNDAIIVFLAVTENGLALEYALEDQKKNQTIAKMAIKAINFVDESLRKDFIEIAICEELSEPRNGISKMEMTQFFVLVVLLLIVLPWTYCKKRNKNLVQERTIIEKEEEKLLESFLKNNENHHNGNLVLVEGKGLQESDGTKKGGNRFSGDVINYLLRRNVRLRKMLELEGSLEGKYIDNYEIVKLVGGTGTEGKKMEGTTARVCLVVPKFIHPEVKLAMKVRFNYGYNDTKEIRDMIIIKEYNNLPLHPNIVRIHHCFIQDIEKMSQEHIQKLQWTYDKSVVISRTAVFIMEYFENGSVLDLKKKRLKTRSKGKQYPLFSRDETLKLARDMCRAIAKLKESYIVHLDLKPANIMIRKYKDGYDFVLIDFGCHFCGTRTNKFNPKTESFSTTPNTMTPEVFDNISNKDVELRVEMYDIYGLGLLLYSLYSKRQVSVGQPVPELNKKECKCEVIRSLVSRMTNPEPKERISAKEVLKELKDLEQKEEKSHCKKEIEVNEKENMKEW